MKKERNLKIISWALMLSVLILAFAAWAGERLNGRSLTVYSYFPLLGLGAFSIMWTHYILGSVRRRLGLQASENKQYLKYSSLLVLVLLLLHPGLLVIQLNKDGFGFPPMSYLRVYSEPLMQFAIVLGTLSLAIFLAYELRRIFRKKSWWRYVDYAQIAAMCMIFFHGLSLGRELSVPWYKTVWFFYGVSLVLAVSYNAWYDKGMVNKKRGNDGKA